jgi:hypothetical protein
MGDYYKYSILTIAVDAASGDHGGFLTTPRHRKAMPKPVGLRIPGEDSHQLYVELRDSKGSPTDWDTPLGRRAWALQEDLVSPRSLHYTSDQIIWQCQFDVYCENDIHPRGRKGDIKHFFLKQHKEEHFIESPAPSQVYPRKLNFPGPTARWYSTLSYYVRQSLTIKDDRLPAIAGIARETQALNHLPTKPASG